MRFIADPTLGKLAKWLRIFGCDTLFYRESDLDFLIGMAKKENRTILTKNTLFKKRRVPVPYMFIQKQKPLEQLKEVVDHYGLSRDNLFKLCIRCNKSLVSVDKGEIKERVPEFVYQNVDTFTLCPHCKRVYWPGTHRERMTEWILSITGQEKKSF